MQDERHVALKRWEKARQIATLDAENPVMGPAALCRVKKVEDQGGGDSQFPVFIVQIFAKDLVCVKAYEEPAPIGVPGAYWLVRNGIRWEEYLPHIVANYQAGLPVPQPFQPLRKMGSELVAKLATLPCHLLSEIFMKMRAEGLLPATVELSKATCPPTLTWERLRACFQDFKES